MEIDKTKPSREMVVKNHLIAVASQLKIGREVIDMPDMGMAILSKSIIPASAGKDQSFIFICTKQISNKETLTRFGRSLDCFNDFAA